MIYDSISHISLHNIYVKKKKKVLPALWKPTTPTTICGSICTFDLSTPNSGSQKPSAHCSRQYFQ